MPIRRNYRPSRAASSDPAPDLAQDLRAVCLIADELLSRYATIAYRQLGSYRAAATRLGLDRRTVKGKVDPTLLARLRGS